MATTTKVGAVPDGSGRSVRADFNEVDLALSTTFASGTAPSPTYPYLVWHDTAAGMIRRRSAANDAWLILENYGATSAPTATDDSADGYIGGSKWVWSAQSRVWLCGSATAGAAVWREVSSSAGGGGLIGSVNASFQVSGAGELSAVFGTASGTICQGNDTRLSNSRTPTAHVHPYADLTGVAAAHHTHTFDDIIGDIDALDVVSDIGVIYGNYSGTDRLIDGNANQGYQPINGNGF